MSLQVHSDVLKYQSRLGYYGELYFQYPGRREEHIGFIAAWRIFKFKGPGADRSPVWISEFLQSLLTGEGDDQFKETLREVYDEDGLPEQSIRDCDIEIYQGLSSETTDLMFIPMIWITPRVRIFVPPPLGLSIRC